MGNGSELHYSLLINKIVGTENDNALFTILRCSDYEKCSKKRFFYQVHCYTRVD